jgi:signal transduction protein with GAF and PtsI domain
MNITRGTNWVEMWFKDKECMIDTMVRNMTADLEAGYDYFGKAITDQRNMIDEYKKKFEAQLDSFKEMEDSKVNRWCYYDMKKRGVI